jgi:hypothetical protein
MQTEKRRRGRPSNGVATKAPTSFRLSAKAHAILSALAEDGGLSQASVIELALRDMAKGRGLNVTDLEGKVAA